MHKIYSSLETETAKTLVDNNENIVN